MGRAVSSNLRSSLSKDSTYRRLVEAHLQTLRAAVQMLQERLRILISYVTEVVAGKHILLLSVHFTYAIPYSLPGNAKKDHTTLRALSALIASLPSSEHQEFRQEFDTVNTSRYLSPS